MMKLKPCPFCGDTNIEVESEDGRYWYAFCDRCLCEGPNVLSKKAAIEQWNGRISDVPEKGLRDKLASEAPIHFSTIKEHYRENFAMSELITLLIRFRYEYADKLLEAMKK